MATKSSPPRAGSESTNWRELYRAAILELNPSKLSQHIAEAERALIERGRELVQEIGDNVQRGKDFIHIAGCCPALLPTVCGLGRWSSVPNTHVFRS